MSVNKFKPHVYVVPEDGRDRQIANGFVGHPRIAARQVQVVAPAGGWPSVLAVFKKEYVPLLRRNTDAHVVLLVDFDLQGEDRLTLFRSDIPDELRPRVFVVGPRDNPEALRQSLRLDYESIGMGLADECVNGRTETWGSVDLAHNRDECLRLLNAVTPPFLFLR